MRCGAHGLDHAPSALVFGIVYRGRMAMKALKKVNRKLYYAIKYVCLGGLLAAFIVWA